MSKIIVGSEEWCGFPSLGVPLIKARVDSGAKTSSIHAFNIQRFKREGEAWVSFEVHPLQDDRKVVIRCESKIVDRRYVKSSSGLSERRYVIRVPLALADKIWEIDLTLANRDSMGYRMLLGREAMSGKLLVDPDERFCLGDVSLDNILKHYPEETEVRRGLRIAVLGHDPNTYSSQRLIEVGSERGHEMSFLRINQCYMKLELANPEIYYRGGRLLNNLDVVIPRIPRPQTYYGCALVRQFEHQGVYSLNSSLSIRNARDKLNFLQIMLKHSLSIPTTGFASTPLDSQDLVDAVGGAPVMIKLLEGTHGKDTVQADTKQAAETVINAIKSLRANLLVQEHIKEAKGKTIRCYVVDGKVVGALEKDAFPSLTPSQEYNGDVGFAIVKLSSEEKNLSIKAVKALGLKIASVDFFRSNKGALVSQVNAAPGLEAVEVISGKDVSGMLIALIEKKLNYRRALASEHGHHIV